MAISSKVNGARLRGFMRSAPPALTLALLGPASVSQEAAGVRVLVAQGQVRYAAPLQPPAATTPRFGFKLQTAQSAAIALNAYAGYFGITSLRRNWSSRGPYGLALTARSFVTANSSRTASDRRRARPVPG